MKKSEETSHGILKRWSSAISFNYGPDNRVDFTSCLGSFLHFWQELQGNLLLLILLCMGIFNTTSKERKTFTSLIKKSKASIQMVVEADNQGIKYARTLIKLVRPSKESPVISSSGDLDFHNLSTTILAMATL